MIRIALSEELSGMIYLSPQSRYNSDPDQFRDGASKR